MSFNIRDYVSDDHIESIGEIASGQARIIQALSLDNSQKDKEIERLKDVIKNKHLKEIERLNKIRRQVIDELFELKDMIYKPETREINFDVQRKISSMIVKLGSDK